jgi:hypothetical protein
MMPPATAVEAGHAVPEQCPAALPAGGQQDGEVAGFLRHFVGDDGQRGAPAQRGIGEEGRGDQQAVGEVVEAVADQDGQVSPWLPAAPCRWWWLWVWSSHCCPPWCMSDVAAGVVGVAPQRVFFQDEEGEDAAQQQRKHLARREAAFQRLGQQVQRRRRQQQAGGEAHREAQPLARQAEHHQRRRGDAEHAAEQAGEDDLGEERQVHRGGWAGIVKREAPFKHSKATNATVLHLSAAVVSSAMASATIPSSPADLIRAAGIKVTRGRVRVLEALHDAARQPLCHAETGGAARH